VRAVGRVSRRGRSIIAGTLVLLTAGCDAGGGAPPASTADILAARGAGEALLQQDRLDEAAAEFDRLIEIAPEDPAGYAGLGLIALRDGRLDDAERLLSVARERSPDDPELTLAVARLRWEAGAADAARTLLLEALEDDPTHARTLWLLAVIEEATTGRGSPAHVERLAATSDASPGNIAARVELVSAHLAAGSTDDAVAGMEELRQIAPDLPRESVTSFAAAEDAARAGNAAAAIAAFDGFRRFYEVTGPFQAASTELRPPAGRLVGVPFLRFSSADNLRVVEEADVLAALRYSDASQLSGFTALNDSRTGSGDAGSAIAIGDFDGDGDEDALWLDEGTGRFLRVELGQFVDVSGEVGALTADADELLFVDLDDDRRLDVFAGGSTPSALHQTDDGTFESIPTVGLAGGTTGTTHRIIAADLDQDGDLDVLEAREGPNRFFRNNGDLSFDEMAGEAGLAGPSGGTTFDLAFSDLDDDRDLDLVLAEGAAGVRVLRNERAGRFEDATAAFGLGSERSGDATAVLLEDLNNDGRPDLSVAGAAGLSVYLATGDGTFEPVPRITVDLGGLAPRDLEAFDFDNDGWVDVGVAGSGVGSGLVLLRNVRDDLEDASRFLPSPLASLSRLTETDYNDDGDSDLVLLTAAGDLELLRNDGGNANHFIRLDLMGLGDGSRKNNRFGIGARIEVRVGDLLQTRTVTRPAVRFGLDGRLKADVVRVEWPNGVAQDLYFPGTDQDLIEQQSLKGSCPLLYLWNGEGFEFVGDVMWKSALGMPLGILGGGQQAYAPGYPSQEYRRLPPGVLKPRDGEYLMQVTEELWETIYVDDVDLVAVDHPDSVDVFVDERFVPPAPTGLELWTVNARHSLVSAFDGEGRDHLDALAERDFTYVSSLRAGRFQGIAEPHELILDLGDAAREGEVVLFLTGWIFPTDASINVAMRQSDAVVARFPALDVMGPDGDWQTVIPDLGFPSGKDKTMVVDLSGLFPTADRRVRIRTNLMVYWDEAFYSVGGEDTSATITRLAPRAADLHYRGFSREYRKGGRYGPHWFDYETVSTDPMWSDLAGTYTRYGDVTDLVQAGDDMYVVSNAGDEITLRFSADQLPALPAGWTRTFLIYTDGWVKDGDLNTATGDRVDPLPFRGQTTYPHGPGDAYPDDSSHRAYLETYQTRVVRPRF